MPGTHHDDPWGTLFNVMGSNWKFKFSSFFAFLWPAQLDKGVRLSASNINDLDLSFWENLDEDNILGEKLVRSQTNIYKFPKNPIFALQVTKMSGPSLAQICPSEVIYSSRQSSTSHFLGPGRSGHSLWWSLSDSIQCSGFKLKIWIFIIFCIFFEFWWLAKPSRFDHQISMIWTSPLVRT